ncbi:MAG: hypothetical protein QTN59_11980 [Candidatus Electrothrix communis]|nr:MAG: hypothetical protein QTN59_11980 [Candidatus Electrothrix communis]
MLSRRSKQNSVVTKGKDSDAGITGQNRKVERGGVQGGVEG